MIHYQLRCGADHEFDGWFAGSAGFEDQAAKHLIACPVCAGTDITRALMAPGIRAKGRLAPPPTAQPSAAAAPAAGGVIPDHLRIALRQLRHQVETQCDYVGPDFADEARRIHNGEAEPRGIYGESTDAQIETLADEGIEISRIPWVPTADS